MRDYVVIFGAGVRPDGTPSGSLKRRVAGAINWWRDHSDVVFVPTGGVGQYGPAEARVMSAMLVEAGIDACRIVIEDQARDTLQSVMLCDRILRGRADVGAIICCTSAYHQPRCALLFRMLGYRTVNPAMPPDRPWLPWSKYLRFCSKEWLSTPYDVIQLALARRLPKRLEGKR